MLKRELLDLDCGSCGISAEIVDSRKGQAQRAGNKVMAKCEDGRR